VADYGRDPRPCGPGGSPAPGDLGLTPTPDTGERLSPENRWDEATRPIRPEPPADAVYTDRGRGRHDGGQDGADNGRDGETGGQPHGTQGNHMVTSGGSRRPAVSAAGRKG